MAGRPVHFEVPANDTTRAREFYSNLFGWQFESRVYFDVDDIKAGVARMKEPGGKADDPQPVPGMGWFATGTDTEGNPIGLWQTDPAAA
jgi:uncharacterized protein